jgi:hypothetical protein
MEVPTSVCKCSLTLLSTQQRTDRVCRCSDAAFMWTDGMAWRWRRWCRHRVRQTNHLDRLVLFNSLTAASGWLYFFGGLLQILASIGEWIIGNTFPFLVFGTFGRAPNGQIVNWTVD